MQDQAQDKLYEATVLSVVLNGSKTWQMKGEDDKNVMHFTINV